MMTSVLRRGAFAVAALMLSAVTASAQGRANPMAMPELKPEFDRAVSMKLPVEPLADQARKGFLMEQSTKDIRESLRGLTDRMDKAREALKPNRGTAELAAGALALQNDIPARVLRNMRQVQKAQSIEVPLGLLTELVTRGVPLNQAAARVEAMMKVNVSNTRMLALAKEVTGDVAAGVAPGVALDLRSKGVLSLPQAPIAPALAPTTVRPPQ